MNETYGDLMSEYQQVKDAAKRFAAWDNLDKFVEKLIKQVAPKVEKTFTHKFQEYAFDDMGTPVEYESK